jgi:hypothetical protein
MVTLLKKTLRSLKAEGLVETLFKIRRYPFREDLDTIAREVMAIPSAEGRFTEIYRRFYWSIGRTTSGGGSTRACTENLRSKLPDLFNRFSIRSVFDAPCGDFNWMEMVLKRNELKYIGGDIVLPLIESLQAKHTDHKTRFIHIDLTKGQFPASDLMICRDCLFHLSFSDTRSVLRNFVDSKIPYLLTSTHMGEVRNKDIPTASFRLIDLFSAPYHFPREVLYRIDDWREPYPPKENCLWTREQVASALAMFDLSKS